MRSLCLFARFSTAGMVCMKNQAGSSRFEVQAKSSLLGAKVLQGKHTFWFRTSRKRNCNIRSARIGTEGLSFILFDLASSSLGGFRRVGPSLESLGSQQCSGAKETNDSIIFKEGTHTFSSTSPNPYIQRPDQGGLFTKWRRSGSAGHFYTRVHAGYMAGCAQPRKTHLWRATFCSFCLNTLRVILTDDFCVRRTWKSNQRKS